MRTAKKRAKRLKAKSKLKSKSTDKNKNDENEDIQAEKSGDEQSSAEEIIDLDEKLDQVQMV
jgi:hypothetical protein